MLHDRDHELPQQGTRLSPSRANGSPLPSLSPLQGADVKGRQKGPVLNEHIFGRR
jgi:hypothetical protein